MNLISILPLEEAVSSILIHRQRSWVTESKQCTGLYMWCESELIPEFQFPLYELQNYSSSWALSHWRGDIWPHGWRDTRDSQASSRSFSCFCEFENYTCPVQSFFSLSPGNRGLWGPRTSSYITMTQTSVFIYMRNECSADMTWFWWVRWVWIIYWFFLLVVLCNWRQEQLHFPWEKEDSLEGF